MKLAIILLALVMLSGCAFESYFDSPEITALNETHDQLKYSVVNEHRIKQTCDVTLFVDNSTDMLEFESESLCIDAKGTGQGEMAFIMLDGETEVTAELHCE